VYFFSYRIIPVPGPVYYIYYEYYAISYLLHTCVASLEVIYNQDRHTLSNYCRATPAAAAIQIHVPNLIPIVGQPSDSILPIKMKRECAEIPLFS